MATIGKAVMRATGMPPLSISFVIVAPLRLSVPQVETMMTPSILSAFMSDTISLPNRCMTGTDALQPLVV